MKSIDMTDKELFVAELALRIVLCELLDREDLMIEQVQCGAHNMKVGSFGDKAYKPEDSNDWIQYLQPMRELINKLDPEYRKHCEELGSSHARLPEEDGKTQEEVDVELAKNTPPHPLYSSTEYKEAVAKMNSIKDRPICVFVFNDLDMPNRIQTMSIVAAEHLEQKGVGRITVACFNQAIKVNL
jgi:hypothetical protein